MQIDVVADHKMIAGLRRQGARGPWLHLLGALLRLAGERAELVRHTERPWNSVTFSGTRHAVVLRFSGTDAITDGEAFIAALPDHEFTIPGQLVAEATVIGADHCTIGTRQLTVEAGLLLLDEC